MPNRWRRLAALPVLAWAALAAAALLAAGCSSSFAVGTTAADGTIIAVGAENQYADVIAQVGGKYVQASAIMSNPNTDPHTFEASASTGRLVNAARLVVQNGLGYDTFMDTIEKAVPDSGRRTIVVQKLLGLPDSTPNPHLWYDPATMPKVADAIAANLAALQPSHAAYFKANAKTFTNSLSAWINAIGSFKQHYPGTPVATTEPVADYLLPGPRRRQQDALGLPGRRDERHRPVGAGRRDRAEPVHPAQGQGVCIQSAGDGLADRILHLPGPRERHPGGRRLRDHARARLPLPVVDAGRGPRPAKGRNQPRLERAPMTAELLRLDGVGVRLGGREVLRDVSLTVHPGEFTGLIGPNGAGKTTLLRIILGLQPVTSGSVLIDGAPRPPRDASIGYVPQKLGIEPDTPLRVRDVVSLGLDGHKFGIRLPSRARRELVDDMLTAVGARRYADARVGELSGGEQQRVMIAHALIGRPRLLLLDEPLANLDISSEQGIVSVLARLARAEGIAVLLSAHDMNPLMPVMDRIVYVAAGRVAVGTADEVVQPEVLSRLYGQHVDVIRVHGRVLVVAAPEGIDAAEAAAEDLGVIR